MELHPSATGLFWKFGGGGDESSVEMEEERSIDFFSSGET
jgi:hypothetical protein